MILERLAKNNQKWQSVALSLCGNVDEAKDLVQEFYLKVFELNIDESRDLKESYFRRVLTNLFLEGKRTYVKTPYFVNVDYKLSDKEEEFTADDQEQKYIDRFNNKLTKEEQDLLLSNYDNSMREVARLKNTPCYKVHKDLMFARLKCLREDYTKMYSNKRDNLRLK